MQGMSNRIKSPLTAYPAVGGMVLDRYPIKMDGVNIGTAFVECQGLYADILCRCNSADGTFCRIHMAFRDKTIDLGIWVREDGAFVVHKRVPRKIMGCGSPAFYAVTKFAQQRNLYPIFADQPFLHIKELAAAKLCIENNLMYMLCGECGQKPDWR